MKKSTLFFIIFLLIFSLVLNALLYYRLKTSNVSNDNNNNNSKEKEVIVEKTTAISFDATKITNITDSNVYIQKFGNIDVNGFKGKIDTDGNAYIFISTEAKEKFNFSKEANLFYKVEGLTGNVVDMCISSTFTGGFPMIAFLMDDGTVERFDIDKFKSDSLVRSSGKIKDLKNVVRLENISVNEGTIEGYNSILAILSDGTSVTLPDLGFKN